MDDVDKSEIELDLDPSAKIAFLRLMGFRESMVKRLKPLYSEIAKIPHEESREKVAIMLSVLLQSYAEECERLFVSEDTKCQ